MPNKDDKTDKCIDDGGLTKEFFRKESIRLNEELDIMKEKYDLVSSSLKAFSDDNDNMEAEIKRLDNLRLKIREETAREIFEEIMKGWVLVENNNIVLNSNNSVEVFKTKEDLLDYYGGALGDMNAIKRVKLEVKSK